MTTKYMTTVTFNIKHCYLVKVFIIVLHTNTSLKIIYDITKRTSAKYILKIHKILTSNVYGIIYLYMYIYMLSML